MLGKEKKQFVYLAYMQHERGFTFVSMLFAITILTITLPFTSYLLHTATTTSNYEQISVFQFFQFIRDEVIKSTDISMANDELRLQQTINNKQAVVKIEKYDSLIRRQVDGTGHEIFLFDVNDLKFTEAPNGFFVNVVTSQGNTYEKRIVFYE